MTGLFIRARLPVPKCRCPCDRGGSSEQAVAQLRAVRVGSPPNRGFALLGEPHKHVRSKPLGRPCLGELLQQPEQPRQERKLLCPASLQSWKTTAGCLGRQGWCLSSSSPQCCLSPPEQDCRSLWDAAQPRHTPAAPDFPGACWKHLCPPCWGAEVLLVPACGSLHQLLPLRCPTQGQGGARAVSRGPSCRCHAGTCHSQQWRHCYYTWPRSPFKALKDELCFIYIKEAILEPICDQICCQRNFALSHYI